MTENSSTTASAGRGGSRGGGGSGTSGGRRGRGGRNSGSGRGPRASGDGSVVPGAGGGGTTTASTKGPAVGLSHATTERGGGRSNNSNKRKKINEAPPVKDPPPPSPAEIAKQEAQRAREQANAAAQKARKDAEKAAAAAAAARTKLQEQLDQSIKDARDLLQAAIETAKQHALYRRALAPHALVAARQEFDATKKSLKTDVKKCTAFVKKIKSNAAWSTAASAAANNNNNNNNKPEDLAKDVATLNLSRYVEEVAHALVESKPKITDVPSILALSVAMHLRYAEFAPTLVPLLWKLVHNSNNHSNNNTTNKAAKDMDTIKLRRLYLRLLTEFVLCGLVTETKTLTKVVAEATGGGKDSGGSSYAVQDAPLVVAFARAGGYAVFGILPRSIQHAVKVIRQEQQCRVVDGSSGEEGDVVTASADLLQAANIAATEIDRVLERAIDVELSDIFTMHCRGAYRTLYDSLVLTHGRLQKLEKRCEQDRLMSGTLPESREKGLVDARNLKKSLYKSVEALADVLDEDMPELREDDDGDLDGRGSGLEVWTKDGKDNADFGPFDDEETRAFYFDVPDLLTTVPPALLGMTVDAIEARKAENVKKYGSGGVSQGEIDDEAIDGDDLDVSEEGQLVDEDDDAMPSSGSVADGLDVDKEAPHYKLTVLLEEELPDCNRREQIDELADKFCTNHGSARKSRLRLTKTLFLVPRTRLDLLPYYSRLASILDRVWSDFATPLVAELEQQFHGQTKFNKNTNTDARMRTARYIGELTKFRTAPPIVFLRCLRRCIDDFTGANVDVACALLESAGRFMYRSPHTSQKVASLMEVMTRLSKVKNLDERHQSLLKAAFFSVKPPPSGPRKKAKRYPPLEAYLRQLMLVELDNSETSISLVTRQLLKLPWSDPSQECGALVCTILMKACRRGRYKTIHAVAAVATNLRTQRNTNEVPIRLVDAVSEEIRWALEHPNFRDQQRTITYARLLGDLFCLSQIPVQALIEQLYEIINVGHEIPEGLREASRRLAQSPGNDSGSSEEYTLFRSVVGASQTILEDEEMDDGDMKSPTEAGPDVKEPPVAISDHSKYDPRVPSQADPPNAAYRIKLVCTVLEGASRLIVTRNNLAILGKFLTAFQRYMFTKAALPVEVEFSLLDTFDVLDSQWRRVGETSRSRIGADDVKDDGFPRFATWLEAHNATVAIEESEAIFRAKMQSSTGRLAEEVRSTSDLEAMMDNVSANDDSTFVAEDEEDDDSESLSLSAKGSIADVDCDSQDKSDEENVDGDALDNSSASEDQSGSEHVTDNDDDEEEFDEEAYIAQLEEEAFEYELRRITKEALEKGKNASRKQVADFMPSGSQTVKKKGAEGVKADSSATAPATMPGSDSKGITFQLLKRGNKGKVEARELLVPEETSLARSLLKHDDKAARERDEIKQRVLQYEADSAEAEFSGGNVYLEQSRLETIRNKPLSMDEIDRNFGTSGGNLRTQDKKGAPGAQSIETGGRGRGGLPSTDRNSHGGRGGRGRGRSNASGRTLF